MASLLERIARTFFHEPKLHPTEVKMAKHWIRQRLTSLFPQLADDPKKLDAAYQSLNLTPADSLTTDEYGRSVPVFEISAPDSQKP
jgi:hypothetical protein